MSMTTIIVAIVMVFFVLGLAVSVYLYLKEKKLGEIRKDVYQLFLKAECRFTETKQGKQKMAYVINRARALLPTWLQLFITEALLHKIVQKWFEAVKDLLDDGKYNKSIE